MFLGYNTNGLAHHKLEDAIELLADLGYQGVAITLDHGALNPHDPRQLSEQLPRVRRLLDRHGMRCLIETGARYLLNPREKHEPTLISAEAAGRARRVEFLKQAIDTAADLGSNAVSLWSGVLKDSADSNTVWQRLETGLLAVLEHAERRQVDIAFEPEPGMFIDRMQRHAELRARLPHPRLRLTLDVGHLHCLGETPIAGVIQAWQADLANVHLEDMRAGIHEHLMFGEGEMDFPPIIAALKSINYRHGLYVELSRHSHDGPRAARQAMQFLSGLLNQDLGETP